MADDLTSVLQKDLTALKKLDPQRKLMLVVVFAVVFFGSIVAGGYLTRLFPGGTAPGNGSLQPTEIPSTTLYLTPSEKTMKVGETATITVSLSGVSTTASDIVLKYDPKVLSVSNLKKGDVFPDVIRQNIDSTNGTITYSVSLSPENPDASSTGVVFSFDVKALTTTTLSNIDFDKAKTLTARNGENTLGVSVGTALKVE